MKLVAGRLPFNPAERFQKEVDPAKRGLCFLARVDEERLFLLPHENQTEGMIEIGICEKDAGDRTVAR